MSAPSPDGDDGAETSAVRRSAVRGQEFGLLRAKFHHVHVEDAGLFQQRPVRGSKIEQEPIARALGHKTRVELFSDLAAHLVAAAAYPGAYAGLDVFGQSAVLIVHRFHGGSRDARPRAPPARMREADTS